MFYQVYNVTYYPFIFRQNELLMSLFLEDDHLGRLQLSGLGIHRKILSSLGGSPLLGLLTDLRGSIPHLPSLILRIFRVLCGAWLNFRGIQSTYLFC